MVGRIFVSVKYYIESCLHYITENECIKFSDYYTGNNNTKIRL